MINNYKSENYVSSACSHAIRNSSYFRLTRPLIAGQEAMELRPLTHAELVSLLLRVLVTLVN